MLMAQPFVIVHRVSNSRSGSYFDKMLGLFQASEDVKKNSSLPYRHVAHPSPKQLAAPSFPLFPFFFPPPGFRHTCTYYRYINKHNPELVLLSHNTGTDPLSLFLYIYLNPYCLPFSTIEFYFYLDWLREPHENIDGDEQKLTHHRGGLESSTM